MSLEYHDFSSLDEMMVYFSSTLHRPCMFKWSPYFNVRGRPSRWRNAYIAVTPLYKLQIDEYRLFGRKFLFGLIFYFSSRIGYIYTVRETTTCRHDECLQPSVSEIGNEYCLDHQDSDIRSRYTADDFTLANTTVQRHAMHVLFG